MRAGQLVSEEGQAGPWCLLGATLSAIEAGQPHSCHIKIHGETASEVSECFFQ